MVFAARGGTALLDRVEFYFDGMSARVAYSGLAPGSAGLYQFNAEVPRNVSRNDIAL
jgi:uncharacterized protein (TIGR03437 family)